MLLKFGEIIINSEHVTTVGLDAKTMFKDEDCYLPSVVIWALREEGPAFHKGSDEALAVEWWFTEANRLSYLPSGHGCETTAVTVDVFAEYAKRVVAG